mmetsp:Transcript_20545/g.35436  ORF Transcript_20545/g.35436 Transcript_20545/m.35436 type:complete len:269 (+) Transcript_20545:48-854(+)
MKLKDLESALSDAVGFESPVIELEQYATSPHLASILAYTIHQSYEDLRVHSVADLGAGCGILSISAALLGCPSILAVDIDPSAIRLAKQNIRRCLGDEVEYNEENDEHSQHKEKGVDLGLDDIDDLDLGSGTESDKDSVPHSYDSTPFPSQSPISFLRANVMALPLRESSVDITIMNPPFGTRLKGADVEFLKAGCRLATKSVYSMHKSSTRDFLLTKIGQWGCKAEVLAQLKFELPKSYQFHRKQTLDIDVDLIRIDVTSKQMHLIV